MNVLFVCLQHPWKLNGGALIRNYFLIRGLAQRHDVHLFTAGPLETPPAGFADWCRTIAIYPRAAGAGARAGRALEALRPGGSYYTAGNVTPALRAAVAARAATLENPLAVFDLAMVNALPPEARIVYNAHNCESDLLLRRAAQEGFPARALLAIEARRVARIERAVLRRARYVAACSVEDRADLARLVPEAAARIAVVPNGVDVSRYAEVARSPVEARTLLLTGSFDWRPNLAGLDWFVAEVLPVLRACLEGTDYRVRAAGRMPPAVAARLSAAGIEPVAYPSDMRPELARADVVAAAVIASSGTRLRILEAWAAGRPVVTTPAGAFGLPHVPGVDLAVAAAPDAFAGEVARLFDDRAANVAMARAALERVAAFDWAPIGEAFASELEALD